MDTSISGVSPKVVAANQEVAAAKEVGELQSPQGQSQVRELNLLARLESVVAGIEPSSRPGHGTVIVRTIPPLSEFERSLSPSDDYSDIEVMKFGIGEKPDEQGFLVQHAGSQVSVTEARGARNVDGCVKIENPHDLVCELEQRLALRARLSQGSFDRSDFFA